MITRDVDAGAPPGGVTRTGALCAGVDGGDTFALGGAPIGPLVAGALGMGALGMGALGMGALGIGEETTGAVSALAPVGVAKEKSARPSAPAAMVMTPPHTEQRARIRAAGILDGSTRNTERHSGQATFILCLQRGLPSWDPKCA